MIIIVEQKYTGHNPEIRKKNYHLCLDLLKNDIFKKTHR